MISKRIVISLGFVGLFLLASGLYLASHARPSADEFSIQQKKHIPPSGTSTATPPSSAGMPTANVSSGTATNTLIWSWSPANDCSDCPGILDYHVNIGTTPGGNDIVADTVVSGGATSYSLSTLPNQHLTYYATVIAESSSGALSAAVQSEGINVDRKSPVLSGVLTESMTETSTVISWSTDKPASSLVKYGITSHSYPSSSNDSSDKTTTHSITLTGLSPGTTYVFVAQSKDDLDNLGLSDEGSFTTKSAATTSSTSPATISSNSPSPLATTSSPSSSVAASQTRSLPPSTSAVPTQVASTTPSPSSAASSQIPVNSLASPSVQTTRTNLSSSGAPSASPSSTTPTVAASQASSASSSVTSSTATPVVSSAVTQLAVADTPVAADTPPTVPQGESLRVGVVQGTTGPNEVVTIYVYSEPKMYTVTADATGRWSLTIPTSDLEVGDHHIEYQTPTKSRTQLLSFTITQVSPTNQPHDGAKAPISSSVPISSPQSNSAHWWLWLIGGLVITFAIFGLVFYLRHHQILKNE